MTNYVSYLEIDTGSMATLPENSSEWRVKQIGMVGDGLSSRLPAAIAYIQRTYGVEPTVSFPPGRLQQIARLDFDA